MELPPPPLLTSVCCWLCKEEHFELLLLGENSPSRLTSKAARKTAEALSALGESAWPRSESSFLFVLVCYY